MKLSKSSWHYKLNNWYTWSVPRNLCGYFWRTVWYTLVIPITAMLFIPFWLILLLDHDKDVVEKEGRIVDDYPTVLLLDIALFTIYCMISMWWGFSLKADGLDAVEMFIGGFGWAILLSIGISHFTSKWKERQPGKKKEKKPNLAWEYIKAKKKKYCPIIEWEEENDERA